MFRVFLTTIVALMLTATAQAVTVKVTVKGAGLGRENFAEFKVESDKKGEKATGHIEDNGEKSYEWDMGDSNQNIWYWWDTLAGNAHVTVRVNDVVVFDGDCTHGGHGEVNVKATCANPRVYKTEGSPKLEEHDAKRCKVTWILF